MADTTDPPLGGGEPTPPLATPNVQSIEASALRDDLKAAREASVEVTAIIDRALGRLGVA